MRAINVLRLQVVLRDKYSRERVLSNYDKRIILSIQNRSFGEFLYKIDKIIYIFHTIVYRWIKRPVWHNCAGYGGFKRIQQTQRMTKSTKWRNSYTISLYISVEFV